MLFWFSGASISENSPPQYQVKGERSLSERLAKTGMWTVKVFMGPPTSEGGPIDRPLFVRSSVYPELFFKIGQGFFRNLA